ncbi:PTS fructose transporter subunit IIB, partial [Bacillus safensis]
MSRKKIVAATGCPTGIAHTFMAAEALKIAAEQLGVDIKVETHGQVGIENALTDQDILEADGVIVAADKDVNTDRFHGKPLIEVPVAKGIRTPNELIQGIINGDAPVHQVKGRTSGTEKPSAPSSSQQKSANKWIHTIYKHLMNG